ncbi:MAG: SRPBCC family protein [Methylophilaceae bacterium]
MIKLIVIVILLLVGGLFIYASTRSSKFHVQRSTTIKAPPEKIFAIINDHRHWADWSPWEKLDATMKKTISEPSSGVGASYAWEGNAKAGAGLVTITETEPPYKLVSRLEMRKPVKAQNRVEFTIEPLGDSTKVTWAMAGTQNLTMKVMGLFINCNDMVGKDFDVGLAQLKTMIEK